MSDTDNNNDEMCDMSWEEDEYIIEFENAEFPTKEQYINAYYRRDIGIGLSFELVKQYAIKKLFIDNSFLLQYHEIIAFNENYDYTYGIDGYYFYYYSGDKKQKIPFTGQGELHKKICHNYKGVENRVEMLIMINNHMEFYDALTILELEFLGF